jgi:two-component system sensor histidine kinase UhpB
MLELTSLFSTDGFMPHGMCYMWRPAILAVHVGADLLIALAYFTIPFTLVYFVRKRTELHFTWIFLSFAIFIVACGISHVMEIWTIWYPMYWLSGGVKVITAIASILTAILLVKLVPAALRFPSPSALQAANDELAREIVERKCAEQQVLDMNATLEARVAERTRELAAANQAMIKTNADLVIASAERKRADEQFRLALEAAPTGMLMMNEVGVIVLVNAQIEALFGYPRQELLGQRIEMLVPERFRSHHPDLRKVFFGDPKTRVMGAGRDLYGLRKDGTEVPIEIGLNPLQTSEGRFVLSSIADITERKRANEAQQQMTALVRSTSDAIITKDLLGIVRSCNPAAEDLLGYKADELIGTSVYGFIPVDHRAEEAGIIARVKAGHRVVPFETVRLRKDGSLVEVSLTISPVLSDSGQIVGASKIMRDITPAKMAAEALRAVNAELIQQINARTSQLKERESLLQEIHHRVKNNLQVVSSLINMQIRGLQDDSSRAALRDCQSRVMTMAKIHEMLYQSADYARVPFAKYAKDLTTRISVPREPRPASGTPHLNWKRFPCRWRRQFPAVLSSTSSLRILSSMHFRTSLTARSV